MGRAVGCALGIDGDGADDGFVHFGDEACGVLLSGSLGRHLLILVGCEVSHAFVGQGLVGAVEHGGEFGE